MRTASWILTAATLLSALVAGADVPGVRITDPWIRINPAGDLAAAYLTLHNDSHRALTVIGAHTVLAAHAMIHESAVIGGQSRMRARGKLVVPPGGTLRFAPGGLHIMLTGLAHPLHPGEAVQLDLLLEDGASERMSAIARPAATP